MKKTKKSRTVSKARKVTVKRVARQTPAGKARAEGMRLFKLAGRPSEEQFVLVYGERGPKMTWEQRTAAGVPATKFQAALKVKHAGR